MRITLDIDDDVLQAVKQLAASQRTTAGKIISELARKGLRQKRGSKAKKVRNGVPVFPSINEAITLNHIQHLHD